MRDRFSFWGIFTVVSTIIAFIVDVVALSELMRRIIAFWIQNPGIEPSLNQVSIPVVIEYTRFIEGISFLLLAYTVVGMTYMFIKLDILMFRKSLLNTSKKIRRKADELAWRSSPGFTSGRPSLPSSFTIYIGSEKVAEQVSFILPYSFLSFLLAFPFFLVWGQVFILQGRPLPWFVYTLLVTFGNAILYIPRILAPERKWSCQGHLIAVFAIETPMLIAGLLAFTSDSWGTIILISLLIPFITLMVRFGSAIVLVILAGIHNQLSGLLSVK